MRVPRLIVAAACVALALVACAEAPGGDSAPTAVASAPTDVALLADRLDSVDAAVAQWRTASSLAAAQTAAETAANLVVGPNGPGYGDRDGDGMIGGESAAGILPGLDGIPAGLATPLANNRCVVSDVLGGDWTDPASEWNKMLSAIDSWRPANNTMPSLASHPMRIVGWATFTLASDSLAEAQEYAGHAKLHVDVAVRALTC
ncbi:hypothetical protein [Cryobacterium sp. PH29-G1]|uniref:hypothetical protein n=1 Tax=Cryobacterium sp. PH29-G1 TaxID=3046211 RepID=UPI0024BB305A|nr:hypothetical protein [Cryobacterium sp. PH29-G1]MDJ0349143.1 hypothetical protein [Cryobacterium sp. PH29-G1]